MNPSLSKLHFLLVEDDPNMLTVLKAALLSLGAQVTTAINGQVAWDEFLNQKFDIVLSDVQMPIMSGIELLGKIREKDKDKPVVLLVTGQAQLDEETAMSLGAAGLIQKPFRLRDLILRLETILQTQAA